MDLCESKVGGVCERPATDRQAIHAGPRDQGRLLLHSNWRDEHAENIIQNRRPECLASSRMMPLGAESP
jgi:hypothetical protein